MPQEFLIDPITKTYGDPSRRPEVRFGTVEYTATADYMVRFRNLFFILIVCLTCRLDHLNLPYIYFFLMFRIMQFKQVDIE